MPVIGKGDHDIGAGTQKFAVELCESVGVFEDDFGNKRAGLQIAAPFEFKEIAFGANDRAVFQSFGEFSHDASYLAKDGL